MQESSVLLSTAYLAPVQYYTKLLMYPNVYIENEENYCKQTYRNRCNILTANGILNLSIPILRTGEKIPTKEIQIDNSKRWKQIHWRAIESAYRSSPFYLYYADEIHHTLFKSFEFLADLNKALLVQTIDLLQIKTKIQYTSDFKKVPENTIDYSEIIHPKTRMQKPDNNFVCEKYYQVFESKFEFVPNLSILDLLFNMGPSSEAVLRKSIRI